VGAGAADWAKVVDAVQPKARIPAARIPAATKFEDRAEVGAFDSRRSFE
jgi:hypothetical protein